MSHSQLITVIGPTASGKTALALHLAQRFDGQIICADSRTVYQGMDIGTAKPSMREQAVVKHYGLDLVTPDQPFTVADFKTYGDAAISEISRSGRVPILVGGSGLFIDAVLYDFQFRSPPDEALRAELETLSTAELQQQINKNGWPMPENTQNRRYLMRTIETAGRPSERGPLRPDTLILGLRPDRELLKQRITDRTQAMLDNGLLDEIESLAHRYGWDVQAMQAPAYKAFRAYFENEISMEEASANFVKNDYALAKRQLTWFKRNKSIQWLDNSDGLAEAVALTTTFLDTKS